MHTSVDKCVILTFVVLYINYVGVVPSARCGYASAEFKRDMSLERHSGQHLRKSGKIFLLVKFVIGEIAHGKTGAVFENLRSIAEIVLQMVQERIKLIYLAFQLLHRRFLRSRKKLYAGNFYTVCLFGYNVLYLRTVHSELTVIRKTQKHSQFTAVFCRIPAYHSILLR